MLDQVYDHSQSDHLLLDALDSAARWNVWMTKDGKKVPLQVATGRPAKVNEPDHWVSRTRAQEYLTRYPMDASKGGLALLLGPIRHDEELFLFGIDLDSCRNPVTGLIDHWAVEIAQCLDSYVEISPSGTGLKIYALCSREDAEHFQKKTCIFRRDKKAKHGAAIEIYFDKRYFAFTGLACDVHGREIDLEAMELIGDELMFRTVSTEDLRQLLNVFGPALAGGASTRHSDNSAVSAGSSRKHYSSLEALELDVMTVPSDESYSGWLDMLFAISFETDRSEAGRDLAHRWSEGCSNYDPDELDKKWDSIRNDPTRRNKTGAYIKSLARAPGATPPGDLAHAQEFASRSEGHLKFVPECGWFRWSGSHWTHCSRCEEIEAAKAFARSLVREMREEFEISGNTEAQSRLKEANRLCGSMQRIKAMLDCAKSDPRLVANISDFDADPMLLGVGNGVLDLRSGGLIAPNPSQMISRQAAVHFDPDAKCPQFDRFLEYVLPDPAVRSFVQRLCGYVLTGLVHEEKFFFMHGTGANGKSVLGSIMEKLMGDYSCSLPAAALTRSRGGGSEQARALAKLPGTRLAFANETGTSDMWDDQCLKTITSREKIPARRLYQELFDFLPTHKLIIRGNHLPGSTDDGDGFWRRLVAIPFEVQIPENERVPDLDRKIIAEELPGVLNWALKGCRDWRTGGLAIPQVLHDAVTEYRDSGDMIGLWLDERCEADPAAKISRGEAYQSYRRFCEEQGLSWPTQPAFTRKLAARGFQGGRCPGQRYWMGYRLKAKPWEQAAEF